MPSPVVHRAYEVALHPDRRSHRPRRTTREEGDDASAEQEKEAEHGGDALAEQEAGDSNTKKATTKVSQAKEKKLLPIMQGTLTTLLLRLSPGVRHSC